MSRRKWKKTKSPKPGEKYVWSAPWDLGIHAHDEVIETILSVDHMDDWGNIDHEYWFVHYSSKTYHNFGTSELEDFLFSYSKVPEQRII